MKYNFIPSLAFAKSAKRLMKKYKSIPDDIEDFKKEFQKNPDLGTDLGEGFRKIRIQITSKNKGKRGGARVITYELCVKLLEDLTDILLVDIYDKSEIESIPEDRMTFIVKSYVNDASE